MGVEGDVVVGDGSRVGGAAVAPRRSVLTECAGSADTHVPRRARFPSKRSQAAGARRPRLSGPRSRSVAFGRDHRLLDH
ncbi:hypothetical protein F4559_003692 [Saccharothrix violaceirubra]|uniref:Uncharacterized protein n=1 Tax=Saccharothrix violaceirubra TaxID=413306 RepID=A0A7W7WX76_9PSEU|nr:hypothetical protein [Saccharothrix violaceirubra]